VIYDDVFLEHNLESHPENAQRLVHFMKPIFESGKEILTAKPVSNLIEKVHSRGYIELVRERCREGLAFLDPDTYVNERSFTAASFAAGAVEKAVELCLSGERDRVFCAVRPPGHHAERDRAMGFCIFNNVAIGAYRALEMGAERVFIVDFDAHHGNGTQHAFADEERVFYFSTHQFPFYPGTGSRNENSSHVLNIPLEAGSDDRRFMEIYSETFKKTVESFKPDILICSAGFDIHEDDPLTDLRVSDRGVRFILESIVSVSERMGIPVVFSLEGGYNLSVLERCGEEVSSIL